MIDKFTKDIEDSFIEEAKENKTNLDQTELISLFSVFFEVSKLELKAILARENLYIKKEVNPTW